MRDANLIIDLGFPVFCRGLPIKGTGKNQPGKVNVPICFGDVVINAGDIIVGDRDGLVVVAAGEVDHAFETSHAREEKEARMREAIQAGTSNTAELLNLGDIRSVEVRLTGLRLEPDLGQGGAASGYLRGGLDNDAQQAVFDLLQKDSLTKSDRERIRKVVKDLLDTPASGKLQINHWREKAADVAGRAHRILVSQSHGRSRQRDGWHPEAAPQIAT